MSALTYAEQSLINSLSERVRLIEAQLAEMKSDIDLAGSIAVDLKLVAVANGGPLDKQVEKIILEGKTI